MKRIGAILIGALALAAACPLAGQIAPTLRQPAQGTLTDGLPPYSAPATTAVGVLRDMASRAAVIFVGSVTAVRSSTADDDARLDNPAAGIVEVQFTVEQAILGTSPGVPFLLREWAGLWRDGPRFLPGQRRLMLLHEPGPGGLSSPVDGLDGAIPITGTASAADNTLPVDRADLRWIEAHQLRPTPATGSGQHTIPRPVTPNGPQQQPPLDTILDLLAAWLSPQHARR